MGARFLIVAALIFGCGGCATERYVTPKITSAPRAACSSKIQSSRPYTTAERPELIQKLPLRYRPNLRTSTEVIFGGCHFDPVRKVGVAVRIRIVMLGSSFGSRLISSANFETAVQSARVSMTGPWGSVFGTATGTSTVFGGSFTGEGWWNGAAWIDVEIQDNRSDTPSHFTVPIASEDKESNIWGYSSGDKAASKAWETASAQLTRTVDEVLRTVRDSER